MGRWGMTIPLETLPLAEQKEWVHELESLGYQDVWSSEAQDLDGFSPLLLASQWAPSLRLGCAVLPVQTRGAALMAMSAAAMCEAAPGRFVMGIGSSSEFVVEHWNGIPFRKPYAYTRDVMRFLKDALAGERISKDYECFSVKGFRLRRKLVERPPILIGALRPGMLELAGREADGAILNWVTPDDLPKIIPHVRKYGETKEIAVRTVVCPGTDPEKVRAFAKPWIAGYFNVPTYRAQQEWLGRAPVLSKMWKLWEEGDRSGAMAAIPDEVADGFYAHGSREQVQEYIQRFFDAGADTVILGILEQAVDAREASRMIAPR